MPQIKEIPENDSNLVSLKTHTHVKIEGTNWYTSKNLRGSEVRDIA